MLVQMQRFNSAIEHFTDFKCWPSPGTDGAERPEEGAQHFACGDITDASFICAPPDGAAEPPSRGTARVPNGRIPSEQEERRTAERRLINRNDRLTIFRARGFGDPDVDQAEMEAKPYLVSCLLQDHIFNEGLCNYQYQNKDKDNLDQSPSGPLHETPSAIIVKLSDDVDVHEGGSCIPEDPDANPPHIPHMSTNETSSLGTVDLSLFDDERLDYARDDCLVQKLERMRAWNKKKSCYKTEMCSYREQIAKRKLRNSASLLFSDCAITQKVENIILKANRPALPLHKPAGSPRGVADVHNASDEMSDVT